VDNSASVEKSTAAEALFVAAVQDRFGEQRGLGISVLEFNVTPSDSGGMLILENVFHARWAGATPALRTR
jgi:hypothetical protein